MICIGAAQTPNAKAPKMDKASKRPPARRSGRIAFIACRDEIRAELERGATMIAVYDMFAPRLGFSYVQFTRYVNADIRGKPAKPRGKRKAPPTERIWPDAGAGPSSREPQGPAGTPSSLGADDPAARRPRTMGPRTMGPRKLPEFHYDPMDAYKHRKRQQ
jgi:hypothetical protein